MKKVLFVQTNEERHWVGDGFPVRTIFGYHDLAPQISPFLLMDYAGPANFEPTTKRRGVGSHPHRGFETVTIVYSGQVEHRDSAGGGGVIGPGDVQWMTAGSGLVHEEKHGREFSQSGGAFEMVQLWVNLPARLKMTPPRYQSLAEKNIPRLTLGPLESTLRVIAGEYQKKGGPAKTYSPINMWDIFLKKGEDINLEMPAGQTATLFILSGHVKVAETHQVTDAQFVVLDPEHDQVNLKAQADSKILFLGGEPFHEPIFGYGPFVMNTKQEILQAFKDFESGQMGEIGPIEGSD